MWESFDLLSFVVGIGISSVAAGLAAFLVVVGSLKAAHNAGVEAGIKQANGKFELREVE